jgi:hypothetical protein
MSESATDKPITDTTYGLLAEFEDVDGLLHATAHLRRRGYQRFECYSPFPIHGLDRLKGNRPTRLSWIVLACGLAGLVAGVALVWWTNATSFSVPYALRGYTFAISGKPIFSLPANIPVIFETVILLAAFGAVFGMLIRNGLPKLYHPLFKSERFLRVTSDRFFIAVEADDPNFDPDETEKTLHDLGASGVERIWQ